MLESGNAGPPCGISLYPELRIEPRTAFACAAMVVWSERLYPPDAFPALWQPVQFCSISGITSFAKETVPLHVGIWENGVFSFVHELAKKREQTVIKRIRFIFEYLIDEK